MTDETKPLDENAHEEETDEERPVAFDAPFRRLPDNKLLLRIGLGTGSADDGRYDLEFSVSAMSYVVRVKDTETGRSVTYTLGPKAAAEAALEAFNEEEVS